MEVTYFLAGVAFAVVYCAYKLWELHQAGRLDRRDKRFVDLARNSASDENEQNGAKDQVSMKDVHGVPVPWGWPGNTAYTGTRHLNRGQTEPGSIQHFVDNLVREKQTTRDEAYQQRLEASMKALLEDRYHSPGHKPGQQPERPSNGSKGPSGQ